MTEGRTQSTPESPDTAWERCLHIIKTEIDTQRFKTWFEPIRAERLDVAAGESNLTLRLPSRFHGDWIASQYGKLLTRAVERVLGEYGRVTYTYDSSSRIGTAQPARPAPVRRSRVDVGRQSTVRRSNGEGAPFGSPPSRLNPRYTFDRFVVGDCNRLSSSAARAIGQRPGRTSFNPFFVYGGVGLGKTHLIQAIGNYVLSNQTAQNVYYVSSEQFTASFVWSVRNNRMSEFTGHYRNLEVLIVDDVQFLTGKRKTQDEFFHVFNALHQSGKQIVLSADRPPSEIDGIDEFLISRFQWGMLVDIQMPDADTRMQILQQKVREQNVDIEPDVLRFVAQHVKNNVRQLEGALTKLLAVAQLNAIPVDIQLARSILGDTFSHSRPAHTIDYIADVVSEHTGVSRELLAAKSRKRKTVFARHVAMYFAKHLSGKPLTSIGRFFGGRDHSTVLHAVRSIEHQIGYDESVRRSVEEIRQKLKAAGVG
jgi:chromosomal replication initiator protein